MTKALELAKVVLNETDKPMTAKEIYDYAVTNHNDLVNITFNGLTPVETLAANLYVNSKKIGSEFIKYKIGSTAAKFGLKNKVYQSMPINASIPTLLTPIVQREIDLHPFLVSFMQNQYNCYCKTINANKSKNTSKNKNTWLHPDIIGVQFKKEFYEDKTLNLMKINNENLFDLYSFEMKQSITMATLNAEFFQTASNSSWANYGYLVAKDFDEEDKDLLEKLERLHNTFGIGLIKLDVKTFNNSKMIFEANRKEIVDYSFIDDLMKLNNNDIEILFNEIIAICNDTRNSVVSNIFDKAFDSDVEGEAFAKKKGLIQ